MAFPSSFYRDMMREALSSINGYLFFKVSRGYYEGRQALPSLGPKMVTKKATHWRLALAALIAEREYQQLAFKVEIAGRTLNSFTTHPLDGSLPVKRLSGVSNLGLRSREVAQLLHNDRLSQESSLPAGLSGVGHLKKIRRSLSGGVCAEGMTPDHGTGTGGNRLKSFILKSNCSYQKHSTSPAKKLGGPS